MYCKCNTYENTIENATKFQIVFLYTYMHCRHHHAGVLGMQCDLMLLSYENAHFIKSNPLIKMKMAYFKCSSYTNFNNMWITVSQQLVKVL